MCSDFNGTTNLALAHQLRNGCGIFFNSSPAALLFLIVLLSGLRYVASTGLLLDRFDQAMFTIEKLRGCGISSRPMVGDVRSPWLLLGDDRPGLVSILLGEDSCKTPFLTLKGTISWMSTARAFQCSVLWSSLRLRLTLIRSVEIIAEIFREDPLPRHKKA